MPIRIEIANPGATQTFLAGSCWPTAHVISLIVPGLQEFAQALSQRFELYASDPTPGERQQWQESHERPTTAAPRALDTAFVRGAELLPDERSDRVLDDITGSRLRQCEPEFERSGLPRRPAKSKIRFADTGFSYRQSARNSNWQANRPA